MNPFRIKRGDLRKVITEELRLSRRTGHTLTPAYLFSALRQRGYLTEVDQDAPMPVDQEERGDSLDRQVDRYLAEYEQGAKTANEPAEQMEWRDLVRSMVIVEAPEDDEGGDEGTGDEGGDELPEAEPMPEEPPKLSLDDIDVEMFANDVARLVDNYDNLLEVRRTLIRRAINFLVENYDEQVVKEFEATLREDHGMMSDKSPHEQDSEEFTAPFAGEAGPGGGAV